MLMSLHVTHATAGAGAAAEAIPKLAADAEGFALSRPEVSGHVALATCNRFELYAETCDGPATRNAFARFASERAGSDVWRIYSGAGSARHLFRVVCGLDSQVVGEDQVQGQVKAAYGRARAEGHVGPALGAVFECALHAGKRVRTDTRLNEGAVSVGSAAAELARERLGGLEGRNVAVIGAGETAKAIAKSLAGMGPNAVFVSSRTYAHAAALAGELGGTAVRFEELERVLRGSDVVIVATSAPHVLIDRAKMAPAVAGRGGRMLVIDISVPRNVSDDVSELEGVELDSLDDLGTIAARNLEARRGEIAASEAIVDEELGRLRAELSECDANGVICRIARRAGRIRAEETSVALARAEGGGDIAGILEDFSSALVAKIMAEPYERLKEASRSGRTEVCEAASHLFGVDDDVS